MPGSTPDDTPDGHPRNGFENVVFAVGLAVVLALVAALAWRGATGPSGPPDVRVRAEARPGSALVPVVVTNAGGTVAENVRVEACAPDGPTGGEVCAEAEIAYVPAGAERRTTVGFRKAPGGAVSVRVVSFLAP